MPKLEQSMHALKGDIISHLASKLGLSAERVTAKLGKWLLDRDQHAGPAGRDPAVPDAECSAAESVSDEAGGS
jgi:hypothetical protein